MATPLGDFIRSRRDATTPAQVGLPAGERRRAPGLRRSELASAAGISVEYLTRIEQGRDRNPSVPVINAIADALRLDKGEREHLRYLTKASSGECVAPSPPSTDVRPPVRAVLNQLEPGIAVVANRLGDLLAYTSGFERLARPLGLLDTAAPNLTRFVFTDDRARDAFPDWDRIASERALEVWRAPRTDEAAAFEAALAATAGEEFTRRRDSHDLPAPGPQRWLHPVAGELRLECEVMDLPAGEGQQLLVMVPADDATAAALDKLHWGGEAGTLRAVN